MGGLTFALILQRYGVKAIVCEHEPFPASRKQGGSIDIHHDSGQMALREADIFEQFEALARYEGQESHLLDKTGKVFLDEVADLNEGDHQAVDKIIFIFITTSGFNPI
ncbi:hypothetical protein [Paenibacillus sp. FSL H7-0331]|uniref:hypothetical protein n=1 Tax=Paenibacillus sp. FSL H7-0331 TaxID=1920421 RepID=UPI00096C945F|nr:hypothetical protein [Paenibacillus sp. FSL H7-0331]OMF06094.1 hypothetical protein BK127_31655 [Paenibacillus sp. FSL H7-0331]